MDESQAPQSQFSTIHQHDRDRLRVRTWDLHLAFIPLKTLLTTYLLYVERSDHNETMNPMPTMKYDLHSAKLNEGSVSLAYRCNFLPSSIDKSKTTLVMLHSFLMDSRLYLDQFRDNAYSKYNLIAIDEHGHGGTSGKSQFTFWDTAQDTLELLTTLGIEKFFVLGTSQGGFIALRTALLSPARVLGLILLGTNAASETQENVKRFLAGRDAWCLTATPSDSALLTKSTSFGGPETVGEKVYAKICEMWKTRYAGHAGYDPASNCLCERDSVVEKLHSIQTPVLVMHGTSDMVYSVASAREWTKLLPNVWRFEEVEGGHHYLSFVNPGLERCRTLVPEFIDAHTSKREIANHFNL